MTLWNPLNVFSGRTPSATDNPSASFDPSRTGDPLGPRTTDPAIGIGGTEIAGPVSTGDPRRHPIGFAPPAEQVAEPRFRTEISFRRHGEHPRASATPSSAGDGLQPSWHSPDRSGAFGNDASAGVEPLPAADESVPFFKREISFRRKKTAALDAVSVNAAADEPDDAAGPTSEGVAEQAPEIERDGDTSHAPDDWQSPVAETEMTEVAPAPEGHEDDIADSAVPFYKREISFRRKKHAGDAAVTAGAMDVDEDDASEAAAQPPEFEMGAGAPVEIAPDVTAPEVTAPELVAALDDPVREDAVAEAPTFAEEHADGEHVDEQVPAGADFAPTETAVMPIGSASAAGEPEGVEEVGAAEDIDVDEAALLPAAVAAEAVSDADAVSGPPDAGGEDAAAPTGRFGSRKRKSEKAPKRHGGKSRKIVGLKIGASQLAAAVVSETEHGHELLTLARRPLGSGIVVDGEVRDEEALANAVRTFFDEEKLPKNDVRIGLSSNRIGVRTLDIDGVEDESRFDNAVRFKAHEVLPVALSESVLDYRVLEERVGEDGATTRRVLLVVAPRDQVEPYTRVSNLAGIRLEAIDLEALALLRTFVEPGTGAPTPDDTASVVVSIGHESSTLLVAGGGACEFTRVFDWGGGVLEEAIASALDVRPIEAATILRHLSLSGPGRQYESLDEETRAKATDAVRQRLTPFARELVNSLQFYQTQAGSLGIGGIQITGGTSHLEGIDDALHQMIGVNVSIGDPLTRVIRAADFDPTLEAAVGSLAVPIGLAIEDDSMRTVNLLPKGAAVKKSRRSTLISVGAPIAVAVPLVALGFLYFGAHNRVVDQQNQIDAARAELAALPQPTVPVIDNAVVGDEAVRATAVANVLGSRLAWEAVFRDMSKVLPENVWLSTMSLTAPDVANLADGTAVAAPAVPGVEPVPSAVSIDGFTFTQPDVARLLARLATLPSLKRVTLTSSQGSLVGSKKVVHFVIVADLNQTGGAS